ncbi:hypothetical protein ACFS07_28090 [Undibacterium arcticum]
MTLSQLSRCMIKNPVRMLQAIAHRAAVPLIAFGLAGCTNSSGPDVADAVYRNGYV